MAGLLLAYHAVFAQTSTTSETTKYFRSVQNNHNKLSEFLLEMPIGADLHIHLTGSTYAENLLHYAQPDNLCINPQDHMVYDNPMCAEKNLLNTAIKDHSFYNKVIDAWSMRHADPQVLGHDHFFEIFAKYDVIAKKHTAEILSEVMQRAGQQHVKYLELKIHPTESGSALVRTVDQYELDARRILRCNSSRPSIGCQVKVRYIYEIFRENDPSIIWSRCMVGVQAVLHDQRFVGLDFVQPEDGKISMRDYALHMRMVRKIHRLYPTVPVSLHAGELATGLVPASGLRSHVHDAVLLAKARRIGHGVDIAGEDNAVSLLKYMSEHEVLVEINLSSNFLILHTPVKDHPLLLYMKFNVPIVLSTDDPGISRTNLTNEYLLAVESFHLNYQELKNISRNGLHYSFLPGQRLWSDRNYQLINPACKKDKFDDKEHTPSCQIFLNKNEKARMQWALEQSFVAFERQIAEKYSTVQYQ